jgi:hypothetical protein
MEEPAPTSKAKRHGRDGSTLACRQRLRSNFGLDDLCSSGCDSGVRAEFAGNPRRLRQLDNNRKNERTLL